MSTELIVTLIVGIAAPVASVIVVILNNRATSRKTEKSNQNLLINSLRTNILLIYSIYKHTEKIPSDVYQQACKTYDDYRENGGNSYVHTIMNDMERWEKG